MVSGSSGGSQAAQLWVTFRVADTGVGVDESKLHQMFKPFGQARPVSPMRNQHRRPVNSTAINA